ncbi:asparagine synthase (glutamine-hydrolyzing) [Alienimonas californiensis]|uniref:asparagine synthase (glutamine-hydrolyzing) n=1 Tax=Alienimonas californiensis TaxID=2527989 RepID=A0A517P4A5_9PLAN|nr:asparagine synthase (glutamine-hydrolyzing) [Alienimonas californiensis]QDT14224.1 Asparagine synthetase [glutamine-hydrolyzing] 1 [Alienimonas californiensis]
MCGFSALLSADPSIPPAGAGSPLDRMTAALAHRGPDGAGRYAEPHVGLGHRRLSIIDLAGGDQPMRSADGRFAVAFNGEIYNYRALRADLEGRDHAFRTASDTETLLHLAAEHAERSDDEYGAAVCTPLRGMFAFALWDAQRRRLLLARDRVGQKPVYLHHDRGGKRLRVASELTALAAAGAPRELDPAAVDRYLTLGCVPGPRTIFRGVAKLPPAHTLVVSPGDLERGELPPPRRYWELRYRPDLSKSRAEWVEAVRAKVAEAVRTHLVADVPVGAFLSGGLDSGAVVAHAAAGLREAGGRLKTFSVGFDERGFSELPAAKLIAERYDTDHAERVVRADADGGLDGVLTHYDEPFADPSAVPTLAVAAAAAGAGGVKVVLTGDGGDEAFGGYARYAHDLREAAVRRRLPPALRAGLGPIAAAWPRGRGLPRALRLKSTLTNLAADPAAAFANTLGLCRPPLRGELLHPDVRAELAGATAEQELAAAYAAAYRHDGADSLSDPLRGMLACDTAVLLPDDFLVKVDRATMARGLEARPPLLDHELLELAATIPSDLKAGPGRTKTIFREACGDLLPEAVRRLPKRGFDVPTDAWLRGPLAERFEETVFSAGALDGVLDRDGVRRVWEAHRAGRAGYGKPLWAVLVLAGWLRR